MQLLHVSAGFTRVCLINLKALLPAVFSHKCNSFHTFLKSAMLQQVFFDLHKNLFVVYCLLLDLAVVRTTQLPALVNWQASESENLRQFLWKMAFTSFRAN